MRLLLLLLAALATVPFQAAPASSKIWIGRDAEFEEFLRTARIERTEGFKTGVTGPRHAFFTPGGLAGSAVIKPLRPGRRDGFFESYKSEIAAYKMDRLLQMEMVPPTVERRIDGEMASVQLFVEHARTLNEIRAQKARDPDVERWNRQMHRFQVFADLVGDIDPNAGNWLFDPAWNFIKVDCSRCFTDTIKQPFDPAKAIKQIDRPFFDRVKALDRAIVAREIDDLLTENGALNALFRRRDSIVKAFEELARKNGEANVFEPWPDR
jgi:hypothetical protein